MRTDQSGLERPKLTGDTEALSKKEIQEFESLAVKQIEDADFIPRPRASCIDFPYGR